MIRLTKNDHDTALRAAHHQHCTDDENMFLNEMALRFVSEELVSKNEYLRLQRLTGGSLSLEPSIFER